MLLFESLSRMVLKPHTHPKCTMRRVDMPGPVSGTCTLHVKGSAPDLRVVAEHVHFRSSATRAQHACQLAHASGTSPVACMSASSRLSKLAWFGTSR